LDVRLVLRKNGVPVRRNHHFDLNGAILQANHLFANNQIALHSDLIKTDIQFRSWQVVNNRPDQSVNMGVCYCLCQIISELRARNELQEQEPGKPYGPERKRIREKLYGQTPGAEIKRSRDEIGAII
jgi:hypothetical protein